MNKIMIFLLIAITLGCVSVDSLPDSTAEIDFSEAADEVSGWRTYKKSHTFENTDREIIFNAAKAAIVSADYGVTTASLEEGVVIGEQGTTAHNWKLVSGIYINELPSSMQFRIIVKGVWDLTTIVPNWTLESEARKIFEAMRLYVDAELEAKPNDVP